MKDHPPHPRRIVLTGGPGAGKTVVSDRIARERPDRFVRVPEAATQVYDVLRTRWDKLDVAGRRDVQRRIYHHQVAQEDRLAAEHPGKVLLLDRGTVDGAAYWPEGPDDYWRDLGTTLGAQLARYDAIIWMESCAALGHTYYDGDASNACRFEDAPAAVASGKLLLRLWSGHPSLKHVGAFTSVDDKVEAARELIDAVLMRRSELSSQIKTASPDRIRRGRKKFYGLHYSDYSQHPQQLWQSGHVHVSPQQPLSQHPPPAQHDGVAQPPSVATD